MEASRAVLFVVMPVCVPTGGFAAATELRRLTLVVTSILMRETERAAQCVEETVVADLAICLPVFFRWRKREAQQISRSREQTAAHAQAKYGAFE